METTAPKVHFDGESFSIDAALVAANLGITVAALQALMRHGEITSRCERGQDEDAGRHRLTFFHGTRRLQFVVDEAGNIVERDMNRVARAASRVES